MIGNTENTVLIARNGMDVVVVGPGDSIEWDGQVVLRAAQIRLSSDPQMTYEVHAVLLGYFEWALGPGGARVGRPKRDVDGQPPTQLLFYHGDKAVQVGAGALLAIEPEDDDEIYVENLSGRVTLASEAVHALGLGGPAAAMVAHTGPVFATQNSQPVVRSSDARAGSRADFAVLMNNLSRETKRDPQALVEMFHEYPDQTVGVRFFVDGQPVWVRIDRTLPHETSQSSGEPMYAGHTDGEPMWAALAQKAFALLRPDINAMTTVSIRPFGAPVQPPPIAPMPGSSITVPAGRLTIVDQDGELLSVRPGDELHGTVDPASPDLLTVWIGDESTAARHSVHRNLLGELTLLPPGSDGVYHWTAPAVEVTGLRWLSPNGAERHAPVGEPVSLRVGSGGELLLDEKTRVSPQALGRLGRSIVRGTGPVFGAAGPVPTDAAQGRAGDCYLMATLMDIAENNPQAIRDMIVEYPDGTVAVRFFTAGGVPQWVRVTRDFYADEQGWVIYAAHDADHAVWPAFIEKAYAVWRGGDYALMKAGYAAHVMGQLLPPYELNATGTAPQPVRALELATFLHPMRFGVDTLYDLIMEELGANAVADTAFAFARRLGQLEPIWDRASVYEKSSVEQFQSFLGRRLESEERAQWQPEITAVLDYLRQANDPEQAMTSAVVQQHFLDLVRFLRGRGDQILLSTRRFTEAVEDVTKYPGLVGNHTYAVVDVRYGATGGIELVLRNPWVDNPAVPQTIDGLTYGPARTLILDAAHLTKFKFLSTRGTGTRFAFGNTTARPLNKAFAPESNPPATHDGSAAARADTPADHQATSADQTPADLRVGPNPNQDNGISDEKAGPGVGRDSSVLAPPGSDATTDSTPPAQSSTSTALTHPLITASAGQVNHIVRNLGSQRDGLKEIVDIVPVPQTTATWLREQLYRHVVGANGEDEQFRAELAQVVTPRLISSEWSRLLTKLGLPLRVTYRGRLFPVSIRLRLRNARPAEEQLPPVGDRDAEGNGPPVALWHYTRGWTSIGNSASEHDLRSISGSYGAKVEKYERGLRSLDLTPQGSVIVNQYATRIEAGATVESTVKRLSKGSTIPHTYEQEWQFSLNQGIDDVLPPDSSEKVWHDIAGETPDLLLIRIPKFLVDNIELPRIDPNNLKTVPAVFHPEQAGETVPSLSKFPFYSALSIPNHDELLLDVFQGFRERLVGISSNSLGDLMDFFKEENILGNIPLMRDGWLPSPSWLNSENESLGFFLMRVDFEGGTELTGPTHEKFGLEIYTLRELGVTGKSTITNESGTHPAFTATVGEGDPFPETAYPRRGGQFTFRGGVADHSSHSLSYGRKAHTSRALRLHDDMLHTTPRMRVHIVLVRDGKRFGPAAGTPLANGKTYPTNTLVPPKGALGSTPTATPPPPSQNTPGPIRYLPPKLLHLRQLSLDTTPFGVTGTAPLFAGAEKFLSDNGFFSSEHDEPGVLDLIEQKGLATARENNIAAFERMRAQSDLVAAFPEMIDGEVDETNLTLEGGAIQWFKKPGRFGTESISIRIVSKRYYASLDRPRDDVSHDLALPKFQTQNRVGINLPGSTQFDAASLQGNWNGGGNLASTNPFDVPSNQIIAGVTPSWVHAYHDSAGATYGFDTGATNMIISPADDGTQNFTVPVMHWMEISYSDGEDPDLMRSAGVVHLNVPTYRTENQKPADPSPPPVATIRKITDEDIDQLAAPTRGLPEQAVVLDAGSSTKIRQAVFALINGTSTDTEQVEPTEPTIPGAFPVDPEEDAVLPRWNPQPAAVPEQTSPPTAALPTSEIPIVVVTDPSGTLHTVLPVPGTETATAPPPARIPGEFPVESPEQTTPRRSDTLPSDVPAIIVTDPSGALHDASRALSDPESEPAVRQGLVEWGINKIAVGGNWLWEQSFGGRTANPESAPYQVIHTALSPQAQMASLVQTSHSSDEIEGVGTAGVVAGTDYIIRVESYLTDVVVLPKSVRINTENWSPSQDHANEKSDTLHSDQFGLSATQRFGDHADDSSIPGGTYQHAVSRSRHATVAETIGTNRITTTSVKAAGTNPAGPRGEAYRFTARVVHVVTVDTGTRNLITGTGNDLAAMVQRGSRVVRYLTDIVQRLVGASEPTAYGDNSLVVDDPSGTEFLVYDKDLHLHPDLARLVKESGVHKIVKQKRADLFPPIGYVLSHGALTYGNVVKANIEGGHGGFKAATKKLVESVAPGVLDPRSANHFRGVVSQINKYTSLSGTRTLANGPGAKSFAFVDRSYPLAPRLVEVVFEARPHPKADLDRIRGRRLPDGVALETNFLHTTANGNALGGSSTAIGTSRSGDDQWSFNPSFQVEGGVRPTFSFAVKGTGSAGGSRDSSRVLSTWLRGDDTARFAVPYVYTVTVRWWLLDGAHTTRLTRLAALTAGILLGLDTSQWGRPNSSVSTSVNSVNHIQFHVDDARTVGDTGTVIRRVRPDIYKSDPSVARPAPPAGSVAIEMEMPASLRPLLAQPWLPSRPIQIYWFDAIDQLDRALRAVAPSVEANRRTRSVESMLQVLNTLAWTGLPTVLGPAAIAAFLDNVDASDRILPVPVAHPPGRQVTGITVEVTLYSPEIDQTTGAIALDSLEVTSESFESEASQANTFMPTIGVSVPATADASNRGAPAGLPLGGGAKAHGMSRKVGNQRRTLTRIGTTALNADGLGSDNHRAWTLLLLKLIGPEGTLWVIGNAVLRTTGALRTPIEPTTAPATPEQPAQLTDTTPAPEPAKQPAQSLETTDPAVAPGNSTEATNRPAVPDTPTIEQHTTEQELGALSESPGPAPLEPIADLDAAPESAPAHNIAPVHGVRWQGPRLATVGGIAAPAGQVWESMRDDGDCLPLLLERVVYADNPPLTQEILDQRIAALRAEIVTEIEANAEDYFEQFVSLVDAAALAPAEAELLTSEELAVLQTARDDNRLRAEFDRQVQAIRTPRVWRNAASHLTSQAAGAVLRRRRLFLALHNEYYRTRGVILGAETTEAPSATALNHGNHFYLAVPAETRTPDSQSPARIEQSTDQKTAWQQEMLDTLARSQLGETSQDDIGYQGDPSDAPRGPPSEIARPSSPSGSVDPTGSAEPVPLLDRDPDDTFDAGQPDPATPSRPQSPADSASIHSTDTDLPAGSQESLVRQPITDEQTRIGAPSDGVDSDRSPSAASGIEGIVPPAGLGTSDTWWQDGGETWWNNLGFDDLAPAEQLRLLTEFPALRTSVPMDLEDVLHGKLLALEVARLEGLADDSGELAPEVVRQLHELDSPYTYPGSGRTWWDNLLFTNWFNRERLGLFEKFPALRNSEALPASIRNSRNIQYLLLRKYWFMENADKPDDQLPPHLRERRHNLAVPRMFLRTAVRNAGVAADRRGGTPSDVHVLTFVQDESGRHGLMVIAFGPVDNAPTVHWHAHSAASADSMYELTGRAAGQHAETVRDHPGAATVVWIDYDTEKAGDRADRLGTAIAQFITHHSGTTEVHVYGSAELTASLPRTRSSTVTVHTSFLDTPAASQPLGDVRVFTSDRDASDFGHRTLRTMHQQPPDVRAALLTYQQTAAVTNALLRSVGTSLEETFGGFQRCAATSELLVEGHPWVPNFAMLVEARNGLRESLISRCSAAEAQELRLLLDKNADDLTDFDRDTVRRLEDAHLSASETRRLRALNELMQHPRPPARWEQIRVDGRSYDRFVKAYRTHFATAPTLENIRRYLELLGQGTNQLLHVTKPFLVVRALGNVDFMAIDEHGNTLGGRKDLGLLRGHIQRDGGLLSTSLNPEFFELSTDPNIRLELVVPANMTELRGIYLGRGGLEKNAHENELLFASNTPYVITGIGTDPFDSFHRSDLVVLRGHFVAAPVPGGGSALLEREPDDTFDAGQPQLAQSPADSASVHSTDTNLPAGSQESLVRQPITDEQAHPVMPVRLADIRSEQAEDEPDEPSVPLSGEDIESGPSSDSKSVHRVDDSGAATAQTSGADQRNRRGDGLVAPVIPRRTSSRPKFTLDIPGRQSSVAPEQRAEPYRMSRIPLRITYDWATSRPDSFELWESAWETRQLTPLSTIPEVPESDVSTAGTDGSAPARGGNPAPGQPIRRPRTLARLRGFVSRIGAHRSTGEMTTQPAQSRGLRAAARQFIRQPLSGTTRSTASSTRGDGSTAHTAVTGRSRIAAGEFGRDDCLTRSLTDIQRDNNSAAIRPNYRSRALFGRSSQNLPGRSRREAEKAAGGKLHGYADEHGIEQELARLGPGAQAEVIGVHPAVGANGIGAHGYRMVNEGGVIDARDYDAEGNLISRPAGHGSSVGYYAVFYAPDGSLARPRRPRGGSIPKFPADIRVGAPYDATGTRLPGSPTAGPSRAADTTPHPAGNQRVTPNIDGSTPAHTGDASGAQTARTARSAGRLRHFVSRLRGRDAPAGATASVPAQQTAAQPPASTAFRSIRTLFRPPVPTPSGATTVHPMPRTGRRLRSFASRLPKSSVATRWLAKFGEQEQSAVVAHAGKPDAVNDFLADPDFFLDYLDDPDELAEVDQVMKLLWPGQEPPAFDDLASKLDEVAGDANLEFAVSGVREILASDDPRGRWQRVVDDGRRYRELIDHFQVHLSVQFSIGEVRAQVRKLDSVTAVRLPITTAVRVGAGLSVTVEQLTMSGEVGSEVLIGGFVVGAVLGEDSSVVGRQVELIVPVGAYGLLFGDPAAPQVLLPRDTVVRIVEMPADGRVVAEVVPSVAESVRYVPGRDDRRASVDSFDSVDSATSVPPHRGRFVGGVRYFSDDATRERFAHKTLRNWETMPGNVIDALLAYENSALINIALRRGGLSGLEQWVDQLTESADLWLARQEELQRGGVSGADPERDWEQIQSDANLEESFREDFGSNASQRVKTSVLREHIGLLDKGTGEPLRLDGKVHVTRSLVVIDFMLAVDGKPLGARDPDLLIGVVQEEPGYMSTSFTSRDVHMLDLSRYRMALTVPPGTRGVYIGSDARDRYKRELVLPRNTRYRITRIERRPGRNPVLHAEIILATADSSDSPPRAGPVPASAGKGKQPSDIDVADAPAPPRTEELPEVSAYAAAVWGAPSPQVALALVARLDPRTVAAVRAAYPGVDLAADLRAALPDEADYVDHVFAAVPTESAAPLPVERERGAEVGDSSAAVRPTPRREPSADAQVQDGSAAHVSHPSTPDVRGNCGPLALRYAADQNPGAPIRGPAMWVGLSGMRGEDFESAAAAPLQPVGTLVPVVAELRALGPRALSLVVDVYAGPDARGFGAHAVVLYQRDGELRIHDPVTGDHALANHPIARSRSVLAIVYADEGSVRTLAEYPVDGLRALNGALIGAPLTDKEYWIIHGIAKGYTDGDILEHLNRNGFPDLDMAEVTFLVNSFYASAGIERTGLLAREPGGRLFQVFMASFGSRINQETLDALPLRLSPLDKAVFEYISNHSGGDVPNREFYKEVGAAVTGRQVDGRTLGRVSSEAAENAIRSILIRVGISRSEWKLDRRGRHNLRETVVALARSLGGAIDAETVAAFRRAGGAQQWRAPPGPRPLHVVGEGIVDGSSVHPGGVAGSEPVGPVISGSGSGVGDPIRPSRGDCGARALEYAAGLNPGAGIRSPGVSVGLSGMTGPQFEFGAGARLQPLTALVPAVVRLRMLGHGSLSLVVGAHFGVDARGFGAHVVVLHNRGGSLWVYDPETRVDHPLEQHVFAEARVWLVIVYGPDSGPQAIAGYPDDGALVLGSALIGAPPAADGMDYSAGFETGGYPEANGQGLPRVEVFHGHPESFPGNFRFDAEFLYPPGTLVHIIEDAGTLLLTAPGNGWVTANYRDDGNPGPWVQTFAGDIENAAAYLIGYLSEVVPTLIEIHYPTPLTAAEIWATAEEYDTAGSLADGGAPLGGGHTDVSPADTRANRVTKPTRAELEEEIFEYLYENRNNAFNAGYEGINAHLASKSFGSLSRSEVHNSIFDILNKIDVPFRAAEFVAAEWPAVRFLNIAAQWPDAVEAYRASRGGPSDGSAPVPARIGAIPGRDNCVPLILTHLGEFIGNTGFRPDELYDGLAGNSHRQLERAVPGARLHTVPGPDTITGVLRAPGRATHALIVENHTSADENNVGAHFHVITHIGKAGRSGTQDLYTHDVDPHDPQRIRTDPHTPRPQQHITTTDVIYLDKDGNVVAPPDHDHTPTAHPRHRIGLDDATAGTQTDLFEFREFRAAFDGTEYPPGTTLRFRSRNRELTAQFVRDSGTGESLVITRDGGDAPTRSTTRTTAEFWRRLRPEHLSLLFDEVEVAQPPLRGPAPQRVHEMVDILDELSDNGFHTGTSIRLRDGSREIVAVVRRDGALDLRVPGSDRPAESRVIGTEQFKRLVVEQRIRSAKVFPPMPHSWQRIDPEGGRLFPTLARIVHSADPSKVATELADYIEQHRAVFEPHISNPDQPGATSAELLAQELSALRRKSEPIPTTGNRLGAEDLDLRLAAITLKHELNIIALEPDRPMMEIGDNTDHPFIFLRRSEDGGYELGLTDTGLMFSTVKPSLPVTGTSRARPIPREHIPPPRTEMLAGGPEPQLVGAAPRRKYINERRPIAPPTHHDATRLAHLPGRVHRKAFQEEALTQYHTPTHYMDDAEREAHRRFVGPDGKLYNAYDGHPFDTGDSPNWIFVMDEFGNLYAAEKEFGLIQHSSFLGGRTVCGVGYLNVRKGVLTNIIDYSGHYAPHSQMNDYAIAVLRGQGLRLHPRFQRGIVDADWEIRPRDAEVEREIQADAWARWQRITANGPTPTRPFRIHRAVTVDGRLQWEAYKELTRDDFPPGTVISFRDAHTFTVATVGSDHMLHAVEHDQNGGARSYDVGFDTMRAHLNARGVTEVRIEVPQHPSAAVPESAQDLNELPSEVRGALRAHIARPDLLDQFLTDRETVSSYIEGVGYHHLMVELVSSGGSAPTLDELARMHRDPGPSAQNSAVVEQVFQAGDPAGLWQEMLTNHGIHHAIDAHYRKHADRPFEADTFEHQERALRTLADNPLSITEPLHFIYDLSAPPLAGDPLRMPGRTVRRDTFILGVLAGFEPPQQDTYRVDLTVYPGTQGLLFTDDGLPRILLAQDIRITGIYPDGDHVRFTAETRSGSTDSEGDLSAGLVRLSVTEDPLDGGATSDSSS
ncbi:hypothetical protein F3087_43900 [Nocardia colli]|uniref:Calpain catalytic domain-containing protein n=1 Tax=Nocardia colli TaxID=2545717 RepID=A0A5N0DUM0_9NOCA|nr:hypothetical protein F3087_43900 [Nocardia colli]